MNGECIGDIELQKGVKQGASTSPILFNMIIDELPRGMKHENLGYIVNNI